MFVFVIPLAVACIVCGIFYAQMKTANEQTHANAYMPAEGLALSVVEDTYTHTTETETYDPSRTTARAARAARVPTATASAAVPAENSKSIHFDNRGGFLCESRRWPFIGIFRYGFGKCSAV